MPHDNTAERLLAIVSQAKSYPDNANCLRTWREILGPVDDETDLMNKLGRTMLLPQQLVRELEQFYPEDSDWNHCAQQISTAFAAQHLHGSWASFKNHIDQASLNYLKMASKLLESKIKTKALTDDQIVDLLMQFTELRNTVLAGDIPPTIKQYLLTYLRRIIESLENYKISGAQPVLEAIEGLVGHAGVDTSYRDFLGLTDIGKSIREGINTAGAIVAIAVGIPEFAQQMALLAQG